MKKLISLVVVGLTAVTTYGQGTFNFSNFSGPVDAPVRQGTTGNPLVGSATYMAAVAWAQGVVSDPALLALLPSATTPFLGSGFPGYFFGPAVSPGATVNGTVTLQVLYWNQATAANFATAKSVAGGEWAQSALFQVSIPASATGLPVDLVGLTPLTMQINQIPEPATIALAGLGAAALLIFRRRK